MEKNIKCYICRGDAVERDIPGPYTKVIVDCPVCKSIGYEVDSGERKFYLERDDILDKKDREKLSHYVQKPVQITIDIIEKVTGKKSVYERY